MREPTPVEYRTPELHDLYWRLGELSGRLGELAILRDAIDREWNEVILERIHTADRIRRVEDGRY